MNLFYVQGSRLKINSNSHRLLKSEYALYCAIVKWATIYHHLVTYPSKYELNDGGGNTCTLCLYHNNCFECPVRDDGHEGCEGSPYADYYRAGTNKQDAIKYALDEFKYLGSLMDDVQDWEVFQRKLSQNEQYKVEFAKSAVRHRTRSL